MTTIILVTHDMRPVDSAGSLIRYPLAFYLAGRLDSTTNNTTMATPIPPPLSSNGMALPPWKSHAVNRSNEFLSCARTALKIGQQQHRQRQQQLQQGLPITNGNDDKEALPEWMVEITPQQLTLYQSSPPTLSTLEHDDDTTALISDSQTLLTLLDTHLTELHSLVRRRGHTNDPTLEIQSVMEKFQEGAKEVKEVCDALRLAGTRPCSTDLYAETRSGRNRKGSSTQRRKHYELLSLQLESLAKERTDKLKKELETRGQVLRDQSHRRKLLASGGGGGQQGISAAKGTIGQTSRPPPAALPSQSRRTALNATSQYQSPLFTATSGGGTSAAAGTRQRNGNTAAAVCSSAYPGYAGYGGSSAATTNNSRGPASGGYAGYGGTTSAPPSFNTGMRQRKGGANEPKSNIQIDSGYNDEDDKYTKDSQSTTSIQQQISLRREKRATQSRTQQARLAEKSIAELGVMFTKMSSLISQQGEVLERIEDDVEAAGMDIDAGHDELVNVYGMTKGNRGLILKVFGILIFLIVFMKLY